MLGAREGYAMWSGREERLPETVTWSWGVKEAQGALDREEMLHPYFTLMNKVDFFLAEDNSDILHDNGHFTG